MTTLTKKDYCDYETCVALKELGYPLTSKEVRYENKAVFVPGVLLYSAQKWLREEKNIEANASFNKMEDGWIAFIQRLDYPDLYGTDVFSTIYNTYESALLVSIKEAIEILKEENND
jgi:hypothetical protein